MEPFHSVFDPSEHPHRRYNPLSGKHVLVSPHRTKRPWKGQTEEPVLAKLPTHDPECYLCPGNSRSGGVVNPAYEDTYVFPNDFPALLPDPLPLIPPHDASSSSFETLFASEPVRGQCKVICFHPRHDLTLARMEAGEVVRVVEAWKRVYEEEGRAMQGDGNGGEGVPEGYVQIFENRGAMMGASAPHPHGQVWSLSYVPEEPAAELANLATYASSYLHGSAGRPCLLCDYAAEEVRRKERVVEVVGGWVAVVPFWAVWPFEVLLLPFKRHIPSILSLTDEETSELARILRKVLVRYDNLFSCPFPYSMGLHQAPTPPDDPSAHIAHTHFHFYPPLLRSASIRKFLVGFEMMGEVQAAARLRGVSDVHYAAIAEREADTGGAV